MLILRSLCAILILCGVARAQETIVRTSGVQATLPASQIRVNISGTIQPLSTWLTAVGSGLVIGTSTITGTCTNGFVLYNNAGVVGCQAGGGSGLTIGTSTITSGTTTRVLFDNAGVLGEYTISGSGNVAMTTSPTFVTPVLGTVAAGSILTNATGLPISTGVSGLGANVATALGIAVGSAGAPVVLNGVGGTPSSLTGTNITGIAPGLTAGIATVANGLKSATTTVVVSAATAPTAGQVLTAINGTSADWETLSASATSITPGTTTIIGATSPCAIVNTATTVMGCLAYGATGNTTIVQTTSGGLLTASILPVATTSALGGIKPDGTTLVTAAGGVTSLTVTDITHGAGFTLTNVGGQDMLTASGTVVLPTLTVGQSFMLITASGATATLTVPGGVTLVGAASQSTLGPLSFLSCAYQSGTVYDCASGNANAITQLTGDIAAGPGPGSQATTLATVNGNVGSFTSANITVNAKGLITAAANGTASAASVTPGTTTVVGATAPCLLENSTGTTLACPPVTTSVITAVANATNTTGGVGTIGTSGATVGLLNGTNTFSGTQTFGAVVGGVNIQTGTTYTLAATDCGRTVHVSNGSAITVTTFQAAVVGCVINVVQGGAGQITFANGGSATLVSAHSYTKTFAAAGATVSLAVYVNAGSAAVFTLTGDGA